MFLLAVSFTKKLSIKSIYLFKKEVLNYCLSICMDMKMVSLYFLTGLCLVGIEGKFYRDGSSNVSKSRNPGAVRADIT